MSNNNDDDTNIKKRKTNDDIMDDDVVDKMKISIASLQADLMKTKKLLVETEERAKKAEALVETLERSRSLKQIEVDASDDDEDDESGVDPNDSWSVMFQQLREYRIMNGDCNVPAKHSQKLAKWIQNQKLAYNYMKSGKSGHNISKERIAKLESLGFRWGQKYPAPRSWDDGFEELKKWQTAVGNCNVTINSTNPSELAKWVSSQRSEFKHFKKGRPSILTADQISQLNAIGFNWKGPRLT